MHMPWQWRELERSEGRPRRFAVAHWSVFLALAVPALVFVIQRDVGLNLEDEGFVWYGAQRVWAGEVPLRDFQGYDIARYYWYAAWMWAADSGGIFPLRAASAALAAGSVAIALVLVRAGGRQSPLSMILAVITFAVWMVPYFKVADSFAALLLLAGLAALLQDFSVRRCVAYGVCLGVAASIGINHGLYGVLSLLLALAWVHATRQQPPAWRWPAAVTCGVAIGYMPMLVFFAAVPGFAAAFIDGIRILFEIGMTNLDLAMPSPGALWKFRQGQLTAAVTESLMGVALWAAVGFLVSCAWRMLRRQPGGVEGVGRSGNAVWCAAVLTSLAYAHYFWSRANIMHMAVSVLPVLVAVWCFPQGRTKSFEQWRLAALWTVTLFSGVIAGPQHPVFQLLKRAPLENVVVGSESLRVRPQTADEIRLLQRTTAAYAGDGRAIYVVPYWPGAYAVMSRRAPTWEIYQIFPSSLQRQQREIERLLAADIGMALVLQHSADSRPDLGFAQTHAAIADHLSNCMETVAAPDAALLDVVLHVARTPSCTKP